MKNRHVLLVMLFLLSGIGALGQSADQDLNKALGKFLAAYKAGDPGKVLRFYEKEAFVDRAPGTVDRRALRCAMEAELKQRGAPTEVEVKRVLVRNGRAYVRVTLHWQGGYTRGEMHYWVRRGNTWWVTANRRHAQNPDPVVWDDYYKNLRTALDDKPPSAEELDRLRDLSRTIYGDLRERGCDAIMAQVAPYRAMDTSLGWDLQAEGMEFCKEVWYQSPEETALGSPPQWSNSRAEWKRGTLFIERVPGREDVTQGRGLCCVEVFIPTPVDTRPKDGYVIYWIRTPSGWRIWNIGFRDMQT
jgi:hypothetical protein